MKNKKLIFFVIGILLIAGTILLFQNKKTKKATPPPEKQRKEIPLSLRPYVSLTPSSDAHNLSLSVLMPENALSFDYTLVYLAGGVQQGVSGSGITAPADSRVVTRELLLGSCSKGVCKYDQNVKSGELTVEMEYPKDLGEFSARFAMFQQNTNDLTSSDGNFFLSADTPTKGYTIIMNTVGLPKEAPQTVLSKPYGVFSSSTTPSSGTVSFFVGDVTNESIVFFFNGEIWEKLESTVDIENSKISAPFSSPGVFVVMTP